MVLRTYIKVNSYKSCGEPGIYISAMHNMHIEVEFMNYETTLYIYNIIYTSFINPN